MSQEYKIDIVNPEKSFLSKDDVTEVVVPAFEGEMGILKDHISIISFLKPGIITIYSKTGEDKFFVEDGIIEFKDNVLSILTSSIINLKEMEKNKIQNLLKKAEEEVGAIGISDQSKYLIDQEISKVLMEANEISYKMIKDNRQNINKLISKLKETKLLLPEDIYEALDTNLNRSKYFYENNQFYRILKEKI